MTSIRHVLRSAAALAAAVTVLVACAAVAAPAAFATHVPPPGMGDLGTQVAPPVTVGGMPGWQITLIALAAALLGSRTSRSPRPGTGSAPAHHRTNRLTHRHPAQPNDQHSP